MKCCYFLNYDNLLENLIDEIRDEGVEQIAQQLANIRITDIWIVKRQLLSDKELYLIK